MSAEPSPLEVVEDILNAEYGTTEGLLADSMRLLDTLAVNLDELYDRGLRFHSMQANVEQMSVVIGAVMQHHGIPER